MRLALIGLPLLAVALTCNAAPKKRKNSDTTQPIDRSCKVEDCFLERDVRDFEVIDQTTVIVYVGSQSCPFRIEVHGTFCDLTFAPELYFHSPGDFERNDVRVSGAGAPIPLSRPLGDLRVCSNDVGIGVDGGVFTESPTSSSPPDRFGNRRSECQITGVTSMTDDEILELYVKHGVSPPPPPMGSGKIEVGEQKDEAEAAAPAGNAPAAKTEADEGAGAQPDGTAAAASN